MLTLVVPAEPYWLDLPCGVRVEIRPVTTAVIAAAARRLAAIRVADPDLGPDMSRGLSVAFLIEALPTTRSPPGRASATLRANRCRCRPRRSSA